MTNLDSTMNEDVDYLRSMLTSAQIDARFDGILRRIAEDGVLQVPWGLLKHGVAMKVRRVCEEMFWEDGNTSDLTEPELEDVIEGVCNLILSNPKWDMRPPYTFPRVCEILLDPWSLGTKRWRLDSFVYSIEKMFSTNFSLRVDCPPPVDSHEYVLETIQLRRRAETAFLDRKNSGLVVEERLRKAGLSDLCEKCDSGTFVHQGPRKSSESAENGEEEEAKPPAEGNGPVWAGGGVPSSPLRGGGEHGKGRRKRPIVDYDSDSDGDEKPKEKEKEE